MSKSLLAVCQIFSISFAPLVFTALVNRGPYSLLQYSGGQHLILKILFLQLFYYEAIQIQSILYVYHYISEFYHSWSMSSDRSCSFQHNSNGTLALVPQPRIEHIWSSLKNKKVFSSVDLRSSYHHILIKPEDRHKTTFVCDFSKFEFTRASFGIATSPDFLKDLMNKLFFSFGSFCVVYMDDLLIFSDSPEQHLQHLERIFQKFWESKLKVKLSKSDFFKEEVEFLGHKIGIYGICPTDEKLSAINRIKPPTNVREVRSII